MIIYTDMVADLCHFGHLHFLEQIYNKFIKNTNNKDEYFKNWYM